MYMPVDELEEFRHAEQLEALRQANRTLSTQLIQAKNRGIELVNAVYSASFDASLLVEPVNSKPPVKDKRGKRVEVALWHMTDFQGAKVTTSYNSEVMKKRAMLFVEKALSITDIQRSDHAVKDCAIMFGGDMVEGLWNFPTQVYEIEQTVFGQFVTVSALLREIVIAALDCYEHVTVVPEWGNHGRIGSKREAVPKSSTIDRMRY